MCSSDLTPIPVTTLTEGAAATIHAGGFLSGGFATLDAQTGEQRSFSRFAQMESMTSLDGKVYLGAYPGARLYAYDSSLAWNSSEYSPAAVSGLPENPVKIVDLTADEQVRAGAITAAGDYVALGTEPGLDRYGGVFLLWDPASQSVIYQERGLIEDQSIVALTHRDGVIYGASSVRGGYSATEPRASEAVVFAWSVADRELLWQTAPIPGAATVEDIAFDAGGTLWGVADGQVFGLDVETQQVIGDVAVPVDGYGQQIEFNPIDGMLYVDWGAAGLGWADPASDASSIVTAQDAVALTTDSAGRVWFSEGMNVYRFEVAPAAGQSGNDADSEPPSGGDELAASGGSGTLGGMAVAILLLMVGGSAVRLGAKLRRA